MGLWPQKLTTVDGGNRDFRVYFDTFFLKKKRFSGVKLVGPLMPRPANALNNEMENFMSSSGDAGVIIVSFGTMVSALEPEVMNMLADTFAQLKQKILWRIKGKFRCLNPYIFKYFLAFIQCLLVFSPHRFTVLLFFYSHLQFYLSLFNLGFFNCYFQETSNGDR